MAVNPLDANPAGESEPMRLSGTSYAVLSLLELLGPATPYDLKQLLEKSIENFWPVPHTTFYAEPDRLARGGFLTVRQEQGGRRRKRYELTERGREALRDWTASPDVTAFSFQSRSSRYACMNSSVTRMELFAFWYCVE